VRKKEKKIGVIVQYTDLCTGEDSYLLARFTLTDTCMSGILVTQQILCGDGTGLPA